MVVIGCEPMSHPVPSESIKACLDSGGKPYYYSYGSTEFTCAMTSSPNVSTEEMVLIEKDNIVKRIPMNVLKDAEEAGWRLKQ